MTSFRYGHPNGGTVPLRIRNLGITIRLLRLRREMSQTELAELVCCSWRRIAGIEEGRHDPRFFLVVDLSRALGVSLDELMADPPPDWEDQVSDLEHDLRRQRVILGRQGMHQV